MQAERQVVKSERKEELEKPTKRDTVKFILEEARLVLPGVQALFGFQLIVVFNSGFETRLPHIEQVMHLFAIGLTMMSIGLLMAPAAYDRQTGPFTLSDHFVKLSTKFVTAGLVPLVLSMCLDLFLIVKTVTQDEAVSWCATIAALMFFTYLWFVLPFRDGHARPQQ